MFKNRKKLVIGLTASALCITSVVGGTLAYFTDKDIRSNVVTLGHVTGTLTETDEHKRDDNTTGKDYSNVKPGDVLSKDPTVNLKSDSEDAYVLKSSFDAAQAAAASTQLTARTPAQHFLKKTVCFT